MNITKVGETMMTELLEEVLENCKNVIIPYWKALIDRKHGGYIGQVDFQLKRDINADKGVILNSRILYFFSRAAIVLGDKTLIEYADWAYDFLMQKCWDNQNGGVYWMLGYDGKVKENMKHTYNQAFAIYALSAYFLATHKVDAKERALELFQLIEEKCVDKYGYQEAFSREWELIDNEKLSENGLLAEKTMNTLLHLLEAYTLLYHTTKEIKVRERLEYILSIFKMKVWNEEVGRLEVFFDKKMQSIANLYSYGHDIEASWLIDYAYQVLGRTQKSEMPEYTMIIADNIYNRAFGKGCIYNEEFNGEVDKTRVWWIQAEAIVGFYNAYEKTGNDKYLNVVRQIWDYIKTYFIDSREKSEWFWDLDENNQPSSQKPITEPWKCPYHNGRMCMEIMARLKYTDETIG